jgi:hypothetical protein
VRFQQLVFVAALLAAAPAFAETKTVTLTDDEQKALLILLDDAVKAQGLAIAGNADYFMRKIRDAPAATPPTEDQTNGK